MAALVAGCTSDDPAAKFVGSWDYAPGSTATVDCGGSSSSVPFDTVVETFTESHGLLVKTDSQGCAGLELDVTGDVASLSSAGQSCTIPAAGSSPSATFAPTTYSFTLGGDSTLTEALTASYTPSGASACTVTAANTLTKE
ncbi:MAG TPA: hypothetical protein VGF94_30010 [Kofleriaceae bacterium]